MKTTLTFIVATFFISQLVWATDTYTQTVNGQINDLDTSIENTLQNIQLSTPDPDAISSEDYEFAKSKLQEWIIEESTKFKTCLLEINESYQSTMGGFDSVTEGIRRSIRGNPTQFAPILESRSQERTILTQRLSDEFQRKYNDCIKSIISLNKRLDIMPGLITAGNFNSEGYILNYYARYLFSDNTQRFSFAQSSELINAGVETIFDSGWRNRKLNRRVRRAISQARNYFTQNPNALVDLVSRENYKRLGAFFSMCDSRVCEFQLAPHINLWISNVLRLNRDIVVSQDITIQRYNLIASAGEIINAINLSLRYAYTEEQRTFFKSRLMDNINEFRNNIDYLLRRSNDPEEQRRKYDELVAALSHQQPQDQELIEQLYYLISCDYESEPLHKLIYAAYSLRNSLTRSGSFQHNLISRLIPSHRERNDFIGALNRLGYFQ